MQAQRVVSAKEMMVVIRMEERRLRDLSLHRKLDAVRQEHHGTQREFKSCIEFNLSKKYCISILLWYRCGTLIAHDGSGTPIVVLLASTCNRYCTILLSLPLTGEFTCPCRPVEHAGAAPIRVSVDYMYCLLYPLLLLVRMPLLVPVAAFEACKK